jgi:hypothetical protein
MTKELKEYAVCTDPSVGLTIEDSMDAINMLTNEVGVPELSDSLKPNLDSELKHRFFNFDW